MSGNPNRKYAIVGLGLITGPFDDGITARAAEAEAARLAIADAGLRRDQVDGAIQLRRTGGGGERASFADAFPRILGLPFKFFYTIGRGGALAGLGITTALGFLDAGIADYVVLCGAVDDWSRSRATKAKGYRGMVHAEKDGYWGKPFGDLHRRQSGCVRAAVFQSIQQFIEILNQISLRGSQVVVAVADHDGVDVKLLKQALFIRSREEKEKIN